jgi:hypothetical protein
MKLKEGNQIQGLNDIPVDRVVVSLSPFLKELINGN